MFEFRFFSGETRTRHLNALTAICGLILGLALAAPVSAQPDSSRLTPFDIPSQALPAALSEYARQSGLEMLYSPEIVAGRTSTTVDGDMTHPDALRQLLQGTGLEFEQTPSGGMMVGDEDALAAYRAELAANNASAGQQQNTIGQRRPGIEEIIVTGQKRAERLQDVPIAISAFSPEDLEAQKIEGGFDLLKGVPNVTFSKTNFTGYNFQIRGIGTQAISATTDPGVAVSMNNTTLIVNRLFEQEYLDVERVEVLRGPQGTLFGRNATGGVINVITNKPELGVWDGMFDLEVGNYNTRRLRGFFNAPIGDTLALRGAYASTKRDGYGTNLAANADNDFGDDVRSDVDGRDLWTGRLTLAWQPTDKLRFNLLWERFEEDDNRVRTSKQLCHRDAGPDHLFGHDVSTIDTTQVTRAALSQGCEGGSLYSDGAYGKPNAASLPYILGMYQAYAYANIPTVTNDYYSLGGNPYKDDPTLCDEFTFSNSFAWFDVCRMDIYEGEMQSRDLREIFSLIEPTYRAKSDIFELSFDLELTDSLVFTSQTVYAEDDYYASQDYNRFSAAPLWTDSSEACGVAVVSGKTEIDCSDNPVTGRGSYADGFYQDLAPGGVYCDPQLGCSDTLVVQDISQSESTQFNQEVRLVSSYGGPWNFSIGANYTDFETRNDYFVIANSFSYLMNFYPFNWHQSSCAEQNLQHEGGLSCIYVDPNPIEDINGEGHNYFRSDNPYELTSTAVFGELYWNATETVKVTAGLRFTWDQKVFTPVPSQLFLRDYRNASPRTTSEVGPLEGLGPEACTALSGEAGSCALTGTARGGRGSVPAPDIVQEWHEPTGRLVVDWQPLLGFTDETLLYASYSRGYKGGGANPPSVARPAKFVFDKASGGTPETFKAEYVNAYEIGTKNTLFNGALVLNGTAFYYDYTDYQISQIVDRRAVNENFDAEVWGLELESIFAPTLNWQFNAAIGYLNTEVANGEQSIDLMDRTDGGFRHYAAPEGATTSFGEETGFPDGFDEWVVIKPSVLAASNCVVPANLVRAAIEAGSSLANTMQIYCPAGNIAGSSVAGLGTTWFYDEDGVLTADNDRSWLPEIDAPNGGAGFFKDLSGNELPNAPQFTFSLGGQYSFDLTRDWRATARMDYYWQDESFARIYNSEIDRLKSWSNTNLSFWVNNPVNGITVEAYVKNVFNETPITGTFLNSDDSGLTTNVFTLDPRLIGVSVRKEF